MAPSNPPRPAVVVLLMSMVNEKQPLTLRCAVLYCFECFLYRNEVGQTDLVQTLLPSSSEISSLTTGQLLCGGLFSTDSLANWFSAVSLMHSLFENSTQKEQLLRVLLATSPGSQPISLLQQCTQLLQQGKYKLQSKIGLLMLLSSWLCNCPAAVKAFLSAPGCIAYLLAQISANEHDENEYFIQGLCTFLMGICIQFNDNTLTSYKKEDICQENTEKRHIDDDDVIISDNDSINNEFKELNLYKKQYLKKKSEVQKILKSKNKEIDTSLGGSGGGVGAGGSGHVGGRVGDGGIGGRGRGGGGYRGRRFGGYGGRGFGGRGSGGPIRSNDWMCLHCHRTFTYHRCHEGPVSVTIIRMKRHFMCLKCNFVFIPHDCNSRK